MACHQEKLYNVGSFIVRVHAVALSGSPTFEILTPEHGSQHERHEEHGADGSAGEHSHCEIRAVTVAAVTPVVVTVRPVVPIGPVVPIRPVPVVVGVVAHYYHTAGCRRVRRVVHRSAGRSVDGGRVVVSGR